VNFADLANAVEDAKRDVDIGDCAVRQIARLAANRLRIAEVPPHILAQLKRELRDFDMTTGKWKART
jgi:hypothetical protein